MLIADNELIKLFIANVLVKNISNYAWRNESKAFGLYLEDTENNFDNFVYDGSLIWSCQINQFGRWKKVAELSGITDIAVKVIKIISLELKEKECIPKNGYQTMDTSYNDEEVLKLLSVLSYCLF